MSTRLALWYVAGYLMVSGWGLALAPEFTLKVMLSGENYGAVMPRWVGMLSIALGALIVQIVRHRVVALYPLGTLMPAAMLFGFGGLYLQSGNPLFLMVMAVVGAGVVATAVCYYRDHMSAA